MTGLTGAHILAAARAAGAGSGLVMPADAIATAFNDAMTLYGGGLFNTTAKVAALVSECMMESAYFRTSEEYTKNGSYAPYIGRTFIQLTWQTNYAKFGAWCHGLGLLDDPAYFVDHPARLADLKWAALGGVFYFTQVKFAKGPLTEYADDILAVGRAVNLGSPSARSTPNGQKARAAAYQVVLALGPSIVPSAPAPPVLPTPTGKALAMADAKDIYIKYKGTQALNPGLNDVFIDANLGKSVVVDASAGVDVLATLQMVDATGKRVSGQVLAFFEVVSYLKGTPTVVTSRRIGTLSDQVSFKGSITDNKDGRSPRLRLVLDVPEGVTGLVLQWVQVTGWAL